LRVERGSVLRSGHIPGLDGIQGAGGPKNGNLQTAFATTRSSIGSKARSSEPGAPGRHGRGNPVDWARCDGRNSSYLSSKTL